MKKYLRIVGFLGVVFLCIIPLFFIKSVKATNVNTVWCNNILNDADYSYSVFVDIPVLSVNEEIYLFYLQNTEDTPYYCSMKRKSDNENNQLVYNIKFYYTDLTIYQYDFNPDNICGILFNCSFLESGIDSTITLNYTFCYLESVFDAVRARITFNALVSQTYSRFGFGGFIPGIQLYFKPQYCNIVKFTDFTGATDINSVDSLSSVIGYWEDMKYNYYRVQGVGYASGYDIGFQNGSNAAFDDGAGVSKFWEIFLRIFSGVGAILSIQVLPGFPLGLLIIIPLAMGIIGLLLWIWRG